jgi:mannan endo-1,4-beta-mannosidase
MKTNRRPALTLLAALLIAAVLLPPAAVSAETTGTLPVTIVNGRLTQDLVWDSSDDVQQLIPGSDGWMTFHNRSRGYALDLPDTLAPDMSLSAVRAVLADDTTRVEIYYDDFYGTVHSAQGYTAYSRGFLNNRQDHQVEAAETLIVDGMTVQLLQWRRAALPRAELDMPYYAKAVVVKNSREVYTLLIKSAAPLTQHRRIIESFRLTGKNATPGLHVRYEPVERAWSEETQRLYDHYFVDNEDLAWGIFEPAAPRNMNPLYRLERELDYQFRFLLLYKSLDSQFPMQELTIARQQDRHVVLTLQTEYMDKSKNNRSLYALLEGEHDALLESYAQGLKLYGDPVFFRLNNEMNGDWCSYSAYFASMDTEVYLASWRYVYRFFEEAGVENVIWVWNPHDESFPGFAWNHYLTYYPGDDYTDIIGLTGYNPGTYFPGEPWRPFHEIYPPLYGEYGRLFSHPFMITEFGSNSFGGDKAAWIRDMFQQMPRFSNIRVAIWWNGTDWDAHGNPGRIYKLDETAETLEAFRQGLTRYETPPLPPEPEVIPEGTEETEINPAAED